MANSFKRLQELSAKADDQIKQFMTSPGDSMPEGDQIQNRMKRKKRKEAVATAGKAVVAGVGVAGAVKYGSGIRQKASNLVKNPKGAVRGYASTGAKAAGSASDDLYKGGLAMKKGSALQKASMRGSSVLAKTSQRLRKVARNFEAGRGPTEFATPIGEFEKTVRENRKRTKGDLKAAKKAYRGAKRYTDETSDMARKKLQKESHVQKGAVIGGLAGVVGGIAAGRAVGRRTASKVGKSLYRKARKAGMNRGQSRIGAGELANMAGSSAAGHVAGAAAVGGLSVGAHVGGRIRKKDQKLSRADLDCLVELSERIAAL